MPHLRPASRAGTAALAAALALGTTACTGSEQELATTDCTSQGSRMLRPLADDRSALTADNWVPVVRATGDFRDRLVRLDQVSRMISAADIAAVAVAAGAERAHAVRAGVADVPRKRVGRTFRLVVPQGTTSEAVAELYRAALERLGSPTAVRIDDAPAAVEALEAGRADTALVGLAALADAVGADVPDGASASRRTRAIAAAALDRQLALGAPSRASGTPQVLVPDDIVSEHQLVTISDLAAACDGATIAATSGAEPAAAALAQAYGLELADEPVPDPTAAFGGESSVVAIVVAAG